MYMQKNAFQLRTCASAQKCCNFIAQTTVYENSTTACVRRVEEKKSVIHFMQNVAFTYYKYTRYTIDVLVGQLTMGFRRFSISYICLYFIRVL